MRKSRSDLLLRSRYHLRLPNVAELVRARLRGFDGKLCVKNRTYEKEDCVSAVSSPSLPNKRAGISMLPPGSHTWNGGCEDRSFGIMIPPIDLLISRYGAWSDLLERYFGPCRDSDAETLAISCVVLLFVSLDGLHAWTSKLTHRRKLGGPFARGRGRKAEAASGQPRTSASRASISLVCVRQL